MKPELLATRGPVAGATLYTLCVKRNAGDLPHHPHGPLVDLEFPGHPSAPQAFELIVSLQPLSSCNTRLLWVAAGGSMLPCVVQ